jgi:hypothetical protein
MAIKRSLNRYWLALAAIGAPCGAHAADSIPQELICDDSGGPGTYTVNPVKLRERLLDGVSVRALNLNGEGGVSEHEMFAALVYGQFCDLSAVRENGATRSVACTGEESIKLREARNLFRQFPLQADIRFVPLSDAPATDPRLQPGLDAEALWPLLDERRRFVRMDCIRTDPGGSGDAGGTGQPAGGRGGPALPSFLLTKNPDDLTIPRVDRLKNVPQAEISYVDDNIANTETFRVHGTAGVVFRLGGRHSLIPFVQFIRSHVQDTTGANAPQETSKLSLGLLSSWNISDFDVLDVATLYVNDLEDGAEFVSARLGWRPGFLYGLPTFRVGWQFLCARGSVRPDGRCALGGQHLALRTDVRVIATAGRVLDTGLNPQLVANRNYLRVGGEGRITLFGLRGVVRDLSADISYRHLFGLDGDPNNLSALNIGVNYWIGGSPNASIRYGYERRRDEDTLKRTDQWTVALGLRF